MEVTGLIGFEFFWSEFLKDEQDKRTGINEFFCLLEGFEQLGGLSSLFLDEGLCNAKSSLQVFFVDGGKDILVVVLHYHGSFQKVEFPLLI